jgi:peptidoglycan/LPS O-acetylase OafA/YrhL
MAGMNQVADPFVPVGQLRRYRFRHLPPLDGFRGIAALLVACYHTKTIPHFTGAGQAGIEMFLVLSGFLITSILRREQMETGAIRLRRFYTRRMRRLFPALLAYSLVAIAVAEVTGWWDRNPIFLNALASLTYTSNWLQLHFSSIPILFGHTWSLAVEEQYYLTWPLLLLGLAPCCPTGAAGRPESSSWRRR